MSDQEPMPPALSFGSVAAAYDQGRPGYPTPAVTWLVGGEARIVLELGAGTGKLTSALVGQGHAVHATDPDGAMLDVLRARVPGASARQSSAEQIPANDRSVDVVVVAQAFHWFDHVQALPEIARVLKPGGHVALVWNLFDERIPWVKRLSTLMGGAEALGPGALGSAAALEESDLFGEVTSQSFQHWQHINRDSLPQLVGSRSYISTLDAEARAARTATILAFYDDFGRGPDGMELPYFAHCFMAKVIDPQEAHDEAAATGERGAEPGGRMVSDGTDTDMLLIDFR